MLELNNYSIQEVENLTALFTIVYTIYWWYIYNNIIPIDIRTRRKKIVSYNTIFFIEFNNKKIKSHSIHILHYKSKIYLKHYNYTIPKDFIIPLIVASTNSSL